MLKRKNQRTKFPTKKKFSPGENFCRGELPTAFMAKLEMDAVGNAPLAGVLEDCKR